MTNEASTPSKGTAARDLPIDQAMAERFLKRLDPAARRWTFQTFDDDRVRKAGDLVRLLHGPLATHFRTLVSLNRRGAGVFVTVNETDGRGRARENIVRVRAVWQEDDGAGRALPLEPQLVVETSRGKHHRYLLVEGLTAEEHRAVQATLVAGYGSDPSAVDVGRVLRLPGFYHQKREPFQVRIVEARDVPPYPREAVLAALPPATVAQPTAIRDSAEGVILEGARNATLTSLAGTMRRRGMSEAAIGAALAAENAARCRPPLAGEEVEGIARSVARYVPAPDDSAEGGVPEPDEPPADRGSATDQLVALVRERAELFHDADGRVYATVEEAGHRQTWALDSRAFHAWISATLYELRGKAPREMALRDALHTLAGIGRFRGETHRVWLRVAQTALGYVLDLGNPEWQVVEVRARGWRLLRESPVRFRRTATLRALPIPRSGGDLEGLWRVLNIAVADRPLVLAWILECWRPETHTPVLELGGEQGSGKSETQARLRDLIDPSEVNLRAAPTRIEDLFVSAYNNWVVSLNNVSRVPRSQQDALCSLSTGGGFSTRTLYSNAEETVFDTLRPVVMNGISGLATAQDLIDRLIRIELPALTSRRPSAELAREFEAARPLLLGALLDLFAATLRELPNVGLVDPPRMADFVHLGEAMFRALRRPDRFADLYRARQQATSLAALESSPVACAVLALLEKVPSWTGSSKSLLETLARHRQDTEAWPRSPRGLADALRRAVPALRLVDIEVRFDPVRRRDGYHITVRRTGGEGPEEGIRHG